jgi:hypothetical protein
MIYSKISLLQNQLTSKSESAPFQKLVLYRSKMNPDNDEWSTGGLDNSRAATNVWQTFGSTAYLPKYCIIDNPNPKRIQSKEKHIQC